MLVFDDSRQVSNGVRVTEGGGYSHRYTVLAHSLLSEARCHQASCVLYAKQLFS